MEENKGFVVDVKVMICLPMDGKKYCIPSDEGLHLLHNQEIPICDQRALVNFKSMTSKRYTHCAIIYLNALFKSISSTP